AGATELLDLAKAERIEDAAGRDLEAGAPAIEIHRDREALRLRCRLHVEATKEAKQSPRSIEGQRARARRAAQLDLRSDPRARPLNRHRRGVASDEFHEGTVDVEGDLLEAVVHVDRAHIDLERRRLAAAAKEHFLDARGALKVDQSRRIHRLRPIADGLEAP